ncbi:MAG: tetratricopeptide repeat protein [Acidobacteriota bacterium]
MTDGAFPDRLAQLRTRWESDPSSRVFLQLAEEYRHQGRIKEALAVLDKGLQEHPGYLSALVAKGRCHLELGEGEAARNVLERVVKQDATQMVANKLLVRAYLETAEPARARERLDLYSLLNDSDPEIADLRRQIKTMERPTEQPIPQVPEDSPFDLGPAGAPPPVDDIFDLGFGAAAPPRRQPEDIFSLDETVAPVASSQEDDLFPEVSASALRQRYLASLASEGIFDLEPAPVSAPPPAPDVFETDTSWLEEAPHIPAAAPAAVEPPVFDFEPAPVPPPPAPEQADDLWPEDEVAPLPQLAREPEPEPAAAPGATATLGELYLRQGHLDEAERIFQDVLDREPDNAAARAGLGRIGEARRPPEPEPGPAVVSELAPEPQAIPLDARRLLAGFQPGPAGGGTTARKIFLLNRYLDRIRGGQPDVR